MSTKNIVEPSSANSITCTRRTLAGPVTIKGHTFWGIPTEVRFEPTELTGLYWQGERGCTLMTSDIAHVKHRRIELVNPWGETISVIEHLAAIKWAGWDVRIVPKPYLPYFATAAEIISHFTPATDLRQDLAWVRPEKRSFTGTLGERDRWVSYSFLKEDQLILDITVNFSDIGYWREEYKFPNPKLLERVMSARPFGWPRHSKIVGKICSKIPLWKWPHYDKFLWGSDVTDDNRHDFLREICDHRAQDILGALALINPHAFPAMRFESHCGGHWFDIDAIKKGRFR